MQLFWKQFTKENRETYSSKSHFVILDNTKIDSELDLPAENTFKNLVRDFQRKNTAAGMLEKKLPPGACIQRLII